MLKFICLVVVLMMPYSLRAEEYNPSAPSAAGQAATNAAKKSMLPDTPVETPSKNPTHSKNPPLSDKDKFEYFDKDKSGWLSYKEFVRYSGRTKLDNIGLQKRFLRADKNGDYKLTEKELKNWAKNP